MFIQNLFIDIFCFCKKKVYCILLLWTNSIFFMFLNLFSFGVHEGKAPRLVHNWLTITNLSSVLFLLKIMCTRVAAAPLFWGTDGLHIQYIVYMQYMWSCSLWCNIMWPTTLCLMYSMYWGEKWKAGGPEFALEPFPMFFTILTSLDEKAPIDFFSFIENVL